MARLGIVPNEVTTGFSTGARNTSMKMRLSFTRTSPNRLIAVYNEHRIAMLAAEFKGYCG
jgi:hypothetical protein